jgi:hypothetical protein
MQYHSPYHPCPDRSAKRRAEEKRLIAKGLLPGSNKLKAVLYRNLNRRHRG